MKAMLDNITLSCLLLHMDNEIQKQGQAFTNYSGLMYPIPSNIYGYTAYATPFKQLANDTSISGAIVMSGVYLNNNFVTVGQSGLAAINHYQGTAYFNSPLPSGTIVSGNYAIKDFNIELTNLPEQKLLFMTKYVTNNSHNQVLSGLPLDTKTCPSIFIKTRTQLNKPFAIGGVDESVMKVRGIIIADNEFKKLGVCNIIKNLNFRPLPYVDFTMLPIDSLGNMTGINYNYSNLPINTGYKPWILDTQILDVPVKGDFKDVLQSMAMFDLTISTITSHDFN